MALTSNVPSLQFTPAGVVVPSESDILAGVQSDVNAAFGGGVNPALETPQGQLSSSTTAIIGDKNSQIAYYVNQVDPQYASGKFQDAIGRIYFLTRKPALPTSVVVTLTGQPGTIIPALATAQDTNGNNYVNSGSVTIGSGGTVSATFNNIISGPIPCASGTLTQITQAINGWDAITNSSAGVLGQDVESRSDFEFRRKNSVAANAHGSLNSIYGSVFSVNGVSDVYAYENTTSSPVTVGATSYSVLPHSLYVAAVGGTDSDVANAIFLKKDTGCDYNGNTTVTITDTSGYNYPYPTYIVKFQRPSSAQIKFVVQIANNALLPSNIVSLVQNAIIARFNGSNGTPRERIGSNIFASNYYGPVSSVSSVVSVISITVAIGAGTPGNSVLIGIDKVPTLQTSDITVTLV